MTSFLGAQPLVTVPPGPVEAGQTLIVEIQSRAEQAPVLLWDEIEIPFYFSRDKRWRALTRVPLDVTSGNKDLMARGNVGRSQLKMVDVPFQVQLKAANFGQETLSFSEDKKDLLNNPIEDEEGLLIRGYLKKNKRRFGTVLGRDVFQTHSRKNNVGLWSNPQAGGAKERGISPRH